MGKGFTWIDYVIFVVYAIIIVFIGLWVSRKKKGESTTAADYFLANRDLPWWAVGATLVASNISAEHFIGMSGSGFAIGLGIAAYEWIAAITLVFVGKYFLPIYLKKEIYTMPQFLEMRFSKSISTSIAILWLLTYVFVALPAVIYLGALALHENFNVPLIWAIIALVAFSATYSLYGGFTAVAWTDVIQVVLLVGGGLVATYMGLDAVSGGNGFFAGMKELFKQAPEHFDLVLSPDNPQYKYLPGIAVLVGAMWITNFGYWGLNQYIIQRGLSAKNIKEAQKGVIFAGYLKLLIPLIVIIPGITAYVLKADIGKPDEAYPWLLQHFVPTGVKGLAFAALIASVVASLSAMINSTSTIFTIDIYKNYFNKTADNKSMVRIGRYSAALALLGAIPVAYMLRNLDQVFQYIQEFNGIVYPGVLVIFMIGLFWKQATNKAALACAIATPILGFSIKLIWPDKPFIDRMGLVFIILTLMSIIISLLDRKNKVQNDIQDEAFSKSRIKYGWMFIALSIIIVLINLLYIHTEAFYVLSTGLFFIGIIQILNVSFKEKDKNSLSFEKDLFKTDTVFTIGAIGITVILFVLYFFLY